MLDGWLAKSSSGWLVGDKCTYADLAFFMWNEQIVPMFSIHPEEWDISPYPHFMKWQEAMMARPAVTKIVETKAKVIASVGQH